VRKYVDAALDHSLAPLLYVDLKSKIMEAIYGATDMEIDRWHGMLQAGNWHDVVDKLWQPLALTHMMPISSPESASSDTIREWESALRAEFTDWNHQENLKKLLVVRCRVEEALYHSLAPPTSEDQKTEIDKVVVDGTDMDINQWYGMLQAGSWYDVLQQLLQQSALTNMTTISSPESASSDAIRHWESALRAEFTDWNHQRNLKKQSVVSNRVAKALRHSLAPSTSEDMKSEIGKAVFDATAMDINQWYGMLQAGNWYDVLQQLVPVRFEENATRDGTQPFVVYKDWETANEGWETVLRKRFTDWEVGVSDNTVVREVWHCLQKRIAWALEHPSSRLLPNHKDTIRLEMEKVDTNTIEKLLDMLKAGQWRKGVKMLGSRRFATGASITDMMERWADDFKGCALKVFSNRLILAEKVFQRAEQQVKDDKNTNAGHYAKTIDIVQSSGTGKSRLASEMAKKVMTITFVLHLPEEKGFPATDKGVLDFILAWNSYRLVGDTRMRAMCLLGGAFFEGQYSSIPRSRCQADVAVAKWCKSVSTSDGTLLEKWNDAMSPLNPPLFPDAYDRRSDWRVNLYDSIVRKAEENLKGLVEGTIPGGAGSSGLERGRKWDWSDPEVVCLPVLTLTQFTLLMSLPFRTTTSRKSSCRSSRILCLSC